MNATTPMLRSTPMRRALLTFTCLLLVPVAVTGCDCGGPPVTATRLAYVVQPRGAQAGVAFTPAVQVAVQDQNGNTVTTSTAQVTIALRDNPGATMLGGTLTATAVNGVATFHDLSITRAAAGYTLAATSAGLSEAVSNAFAITAGPPAGLTFSQEPTDVFAGAAISPPVAVSVMDAFGNQVQAAASVTVAIASGTAGATLGGGTTVTGAAGVATFPDLTLDLEGNYTLTATSGSLPAITSATFKVRPGPPASLAFQVQPSDAAAGTPIAPAVQVVLLDAGGNVASNAFDSVTIALGANPGGSTLSGTLTVDAVAGVASFTDLSLNKVGAGYTLTVSSGALPQATSSAFSITAGPAAALAFAVQPSTAMVGTAIAPPVQVALVDAYGNRTTSTATVTVALQNNPTGATLSGTLSRAAVAGVASFGDLSLDRSGTGYTLVATSSALAPATSASFTVTAGPATRLAFTIQPSSTTAGAAISPAVRVSILDALGNVVVSSSATVSIAIGDNPSGGALSGVVMVAASGGVATFSSLSIDRAGAGYTLTATSSGLTAATSTAFSITPAAASQLRFSVQPSSATAGAAIAPAVQVSVLDAFGNLTASTAAVAVAIGTNPSGGTLSGTLSRAAVAGVASFTDLSINRSGDGYTLTAASSGLTATTSDPFAITPAAPSRLSFTVQPSSATAGAVISPAAQVSILDAFGNLTASTATVTAAIGSNPASGTLSGTLSQAAVAGVATFGDLSINRSGAGYTLTAASAGLVTATSAAFNILAGPAARLAFGQQPSNAAENAAITPAVTVLVQDGQGNTVTTSTAPVTMALANNPDGGTLSGTLTQGAVTGVATFGDLSINLEGNGYTLGASSPGLTAATSNAFNIVSIAPGGLVYTDPPAGGRIRLVRNAASTATTMVLDLVAAVPLTGFQVGFNLPLDTTRVQANATPLTPGTALPAGAPPIAARAVIPTTGPLAGVLVSGQSQKAAGAGAVPANSAVPAGAVFYQLRLDLRAGAPSGVVFDGAALGPRFAGHLRDRAGADVAVSTDFRIGRLDVF